MNNIARFGVVLNSDEKTTTYRDCLVANFQNNKLTLYNTDGFVEQFDVADLKKIVVNFIPTSSQLCKSQFEIQEVSG